jgi:16S rRNA G966 N2-methylase RsmD
MELGHGSCGRECLSAKPRVQILVPRKKKRIKMKKKNVKELGIYGYLFHSSFPYMNVLQNYDN